MHIDTQQLDAEPAAGAGMYQVSFLVLTYCTYPGFGNTQFFVSILKVWKSTNLTFVKYNSKS
jgi:hypothetical protein